MDTTIRRDLWLQNTQVPDDLKTELLSISDPKEIEDRFYCDLTFGTGGLRGKIGAGTNRMNVLTVGKATQGLAKTLWTHDQSPSICIAYDTRNMSYEFAMWAASVFCGNGIKTYLFDTVHPTPMLSFAVRHKKASAGIVITASHNPKEYNGYKVYGSDGGQITDEAAGDIQKRINAVDVFSDVRALPIQKAIESGLLVMMNEDVDQPYFDCVKSLVIRKELIKEQAKSLKILYSPLHGAGNIPVRRILKELGFENVQVVAEQEQPDGNFPTTPYPNPEEPSVFRLAIAQAEKENPDLVFATDPDCDRIGVLVKRDTGEFAVLTGNQVGALLCEYILTACEECGTMPLNPAVIKTIVTSDMAKCICREKSVAVMETLTGFKYIGEMAEQWTKTHEHSFVFGFEESYGYLAGDFVRDKDAVIASALIAEMALYYKSLGKTLDQALNELFARYGFFAEKLNTITIEGKEGQEKIQTMIDTLRQNYQKLLPMNSLALFEDYQLSKRVNCKTDGIEALALPKSNVLKFIFDDGSWFVLRPSGTEPKIKTYISAVGNDKHQVDDRLLALNEMINGFLK